MTKASKSIISKISISKIIILALVLAVSAYNLKNKYWENKQLVISWDIISYYAYLPATFIYHDITLKFKDEPNIDENVIIWAAPTENGNYVLKMAMGAAVMYSPFFFAADLYANALDLNTSGYSPPYKFALVFSSVFYFFIGLIFVRKILKIYFSEFVTAATLLAITVGTNILWYSTHEAAMTHTQSFMLIAVFVFYTIKWHQTQNLKNTIIIGITIGLISLIRPTNIAVALIFIFYDFKKFSDTKAKFNIFIKNYKYILSIIFLVFLIWVPQFLYWKTVTGNFLYYSYGPEETFFFGDPKITNGLFSFRKGLFVYSPVLIFFVAGIPLLFSRIKEFSLAASIFTVIFIYITFSWWSWWYGGSFGQRPAIDIYAFAAIPLAAAIEYFFNRKKIISILFSIIFIALVTLGAYHTHLYKTGAIHWNSMTKEAYFDSFGRSKPSQNFKNLLKAPDLKAAQKGEDEYK